LIIKRERIDAEDEPENDLLLDHVGESPPDPTLLHKRLLVYLNFSMSSPIQVMDKDAIFGLTWVLQRTTSEFHTPPLPRIGIGILQPQPQSTDGAFRLLGHDMKGMMCTSHIASRALQHICIPVPIFAYGKPMYVCLILGAGLGNDVLSNQKEHVDTIQQNSMLVISRETSNDVLWISTSSRCQKPI
jgi:hypothetical protein